jgi:hypothetical protein
MHAHTLRVARDARWRTLLAVSPDVAVRDQAPGVWPRDVQRIAQGPGDLGARMVRVMRSVAGRVAIIGTDCPAMRRSDIEAAFAALRTASVAIGPAEDGGFWILAARRAAEVVGALGGVRWSSAHAMADVIARLPGSVAMLRALRDVDTLDDWRASNRYR